MVASTEQGLQLILDNLNESAKQYDMKINVKKTKVMKISKNGETMIYLDEGVQVGGNWLKYVKFADDQGVIASTKRG